MSFDTSNPIIRRSGSASVTYDLSESSQTTITLPRGSTWTSGLHWHETHDESLRVIQGSIRVRLGQQTITLAAGQEAKVPKFVRHEWWRADALVGEDVIVEESTDPADEEKHLFFWNLNGVILGSATSGFLSELLITLRLFMIFHALDNWPVLLEMSYCRRFISGALAAWLEGVVTHAVVAAAASLGNAIGFEPVNTRYTPPRLLRLWREKRSVKGT
jgi:uncharacterized RmlC-like cupin family protein